MRAQPVRAQVYSCYNPHWRGEKLGSSVTEWTDRDNHLSKPEHEGLGSKGNQMWV